MSAITEAPPGADEARLVDRLRCRDPEALSNAYTTYGARLFDYAMGLLGHREAAEDAVHDGLLVAMHRVGTLHRRHELPLWLYALVRNECLRQMRRGRRVSGLDDTTVLVERQPVAAPTWGPDTQTRAWVRGAAAALPAQEREALDLASRHGLTEFEIGTVVGVPAKRVGALIRAASTTLERALDTLCTARAGHGCGELDAMLTDWDGSFSVAVRDRLGRHIASCRACAPVTWDAAGAVDLFAELPPALLPRLLERRLLATAASPGRVASRADIAEPFGRDGYPVPLDRTSRWRPAVVGLAVVGTVVLAVAGVYLARPERPEPLVGTGRSPVELPRTLGGPTVLTSASASTGASSGPPGESAAPVPSGAAAPVASSGAVVAPLAAPLTPSTEASAAPSPSPVTAQPQPQPKPSAPPAGPAQVDALLADATTGCGMWWRATATAYVRGTTARTATFRWGATSGVPNAVPMQAVKDGMYQVTAENLPLGVTVFWHVVVVTADGRTIPTALATIKHERQC